MSYAKERKVLNKVQNRIGVWLLLGRNPRRNLIGKAAFQEKSAELAIPMEHLLAGYVLEQLAVKLSESARGNRLLLKNPGVLGLAGLGRNGSRRL